MTSFRQLLILLFSLIALNTSAQLAVNPQAGITLQSLRDVGDGIDVERRTGFFGGVDFRIGTRVYFQPGLFFMQGGTLTKPDTVVSGGDLLVYRNAAKVKTLIGADLIRKPLFRLRLNAGVSFDYHFSYTVNEGDTDLSIYRDNSFNLETGLGADIYRFTVEAGRSLGLSDAFDVKYYDRNLNELHPRYEYWYVTVGFRLGGGL
jgi:hypothetical protein